MMRNFDAFLLLRLVLVFSNFQSHQQRKNYHGGTLLTQILHVSLPFLQIRAVNTLDCITTRQYLFSEKAGLSHSWCTSPRLLENMMPMAVKAPAVKLGSHLFLLRSRRLPHTPEISIFFTGSAVAAVTHAPHWKERLRRRIESRQKVHRRVLRLKETDADSEGRKQWQRKGRRKHPNLCRCLV